MGILGELFTVLFTFSLPRIGMFITYGLYSVIGSQNSRHLPIVPRSHAFSRAWRLSHVFALNSDWFIALFASVMIGQSNYLGFGFTNVRIAPQHVNLDMLSGHSH